ncbi:MAG: DUF192 domain-containing protein [archaeon]
MIKNITKGRVICRNEKVCLGAFAKARGLMFSRFRPMVFVMKKEGIVPLHMLFVFFPIDVLFADKNLRVVEIKEGFRPFGFYRPKHEAKYVIELAEGNAAGTGTGDMIRITRLPLAKYLK